MHVCFITTGDIRDVASARRVTGMAGPLAAAGHAVGIIALDTPGNRAAFATACPQAQAHWFGDNQPGAARPPAVLAELRAKYRLLRQLRPDLVYVCGFGARNAVFRQLLPTPTRVMVEHCELGSATVSHGRLRRGMEWVLEQLSVTAADGLVCASRYLEELFRLRARRRRRAPAVLYLPYAFDPGPRQPPDSTTVECLRKDCGRLIPLVWFGAVRENYGVFDMLEAVACLAGRRQDFCLHLLGDGPALTAMRRCIAERNLTVHAVAHGYVSDESLRAWLAAAQAFLVPVRDTIQDRARCPSKLYLCLPYQKPIVTSALGDPAECLGEDGFYHRPGDAADMARAMSEALDAAAAGWVPRHLHLEMHTWAARTRQFLDWLNTMRADH